LRGRDGHAAADDGDELRHGQFLGDEEFRFVQRRQFQLFAISLDDDGDLGREFGPDAFGLFEPRGEGFATLEGRRLSVVAEKLRRLDYRHHEGRHLEKLAGRSSETLK